MTKKDELIKKLQEMLKLTGYQLSWLTRDQLSGLTRDQLSGLTDETLEAIIENLSSRT